MKFNTVTDPCYAGTTAFSGPAFGLQLPTEQPYALGHIAATIPELSACCGHLTAAFSISRGRFLHGEDTSVENKEDISDRDA